MSNNFEDFKNQRQTNAQVEIQQELGKQMDAYMSTKWSEIEFEKKPMIPLPDWFIDAFKKVILNTAPTTNEILSHQLFAIGKSKPEDLVFGQIGLMFSVFNFASPSVFVKDYNQYVEMRKELDKIMLTFNFLHKSKEQELLDSKKFMLSLYDQKDWTKKKNLIIA